MSRRQVLAGGAAALGLAVAGPRASRAAGDDGATVIRRYAAEIDDPWAVCHGLRGMGREFTVKDGRRAVDFLLETQLTSGIVNGKSVLAVPLQVEVHPNSFLKTMLEAGVPLDHPFTHQGNPRTLRDVVDGSRALFRPRQIAQQPSKPRRANAVPWSIIAFAHTTSPVRPRWTNAWDEPVDLDPVVEDALGLLEAGSQPLMDAMRQGKAESATAMVHDYTCGGTHLVYALLTAMHAGYTGRDRVERMQRQVDLLVWRMKADIDLIGRFYQKRASHPGRYWFELDSKLKLLGHGEECLALGVKRGVVALSAAQQAQRRTAQASIRQMLEEMERRNVRDARAFEVDLYRQLVGDACHARHGLTLA